MSNDRARQVAIEAKHLRPRLDHVSLRPGAATAFAQAFDRRLTVICAPAGYGKTTTTAAALERCGRTAAWYKLDILDHDPLAFLAAMTRALQRLQPGFGAALLRELESGPVLDVPVEVLAARFCSECDQLVTTDHYLVLDDYHEAMDSQALNDVLGYLLENCPATVRFVVLTRYEPAFRLEKLHLAGEVARLPRDLFLFDAEQVAEVLAQRSGREHDPGHVRSLLQLTEGWPASVVLAGMALAWLDVASLEEALADPRLRGDVFSYLAEQVFQRQSDEIQRFLLGTCCLEHVTGELGEAVTGSPHASRRLHYLARNHIFTFDTERAGTYRYHNLLRDFLRQRFVQDQGEAAFRALQRRTASALEDCGDRPSAVELLLGANELELALGVISRGGEAELERRPSEQLRIWVSRLSYSVETADPWALAVSSVIDAREGRFCQALANLRHAASLLRTANDTESLYEILSITEWAEFWAGDSAASMTTSYQALEFASSGAQRLHTLLSLLSAGVDMRRWDEVEEATSRVAALLPFASEMEAARAQALHAHAAYYRGEIRRAHELMDGLRHTGETIAQKAASLNTLGMIHLSLADYAAAHEAFSDALEIAQGFGRSLTSHIDDNRAHLETALGNYDEALTQLEAIQEDANSLDPTMLASVLMHKGTALRRTGELDRAVSATTLALQSVGAERDPYLAHNSRANLALTEGLLGKGRTSTLDEVARDASSAGLRFVELKSRMFAGLLAEREGDRTRAITILTGCLPEQLALGHLNLIAQELIEVPALTGLLLRRHGQYQLSPELIQILGKHWRFQAILPELREYATTHVLRLLNEVEARLKSNIASAWEAGACRRTRCKLQSTAGIADLTARELAVLDLMSRNHSNDEIASELFIALSTVKTHVNHILRKLGQRTRVGAILEYQRLTGASPPTPPPEIHPRYDSSKHPRN